MKIKIILGILINLIIIFGLAFFLNSYYKNLYKFEKKVITVGESSGEIKPSLIKAGLLILVVEKDKKSAEKKMEEKIGLVKNILAETGIGENEIELKDKNILTKKEAASRLLQNGSSFGSLLVLNHLFDQEEGEDEDSFVGNIYANFQINDSEKKIAIEQKISEVDDIYLETENLISVDFYHNAIFENQEKAVKDAEIQAKKLLENQNLQVVGVKNMEVLSDTFSFKKPTVKDGYYKLDGKKLDSKVKVEFLVK